MGRCMQSDTVSLRPSRSRLPDYHTMASSSMLVLLVSACLMAQSMAFYGYGGLGGYYGYGLGGGIGLGYGGYGLGGWGMPYGGYGLGLGYGYGLGLGLGVGIAPAIGVGMPFLGGIGKVAY